MQLVALLSDYSCGVEVCVEQYQIFSSAHSSNGVRPSKVNGPSCTGGTLSLAHSPLMTAAMTAAAIPIGALPRKALFATAAP